MPVELLAQHVHEPRHLQTVQDTQLAPVKASCPLVFVPYDLFPDERVQVPGGGPCHSVPLHTWGRRRALCRRQRIFGGRHRAGRRGQQGPRRRRCQQNLPPPFLVASVRTAAIFRFLGLANVVCGAGGLSRILRAHERRAVVRRVLAPPVRQENLFELRADPR